MDSAQSRYSSGPAPLSEAIAKFIEPGPAGITQRYETASKLNVLWVQLLPPALAQHCRMTDFSQGLLTVEADSPSFLYEMRISSQQLIQFLRQGCPSAKVRAIKVILAR
jgi:hypothetical protein